MCKFRGAGQGVRVLVAEVVVGELARRIGLRTPRLVALDLDPEIARYEADEEVQDLLNASVGSQPRHRLPARLVRLRRPGDRGRRRGRRGCCGWTRSPPTSTGPGATPTCCSGTATSGSSTTARRSTSTTGGGGVTDPARFAAQPWDVGDHVFERVRRPRCRELDAEVAARLGRDVFAEVLAQVPDDWLEPVPGAETPDALRAAYVDFLVARLGTRQWLPGGVAHDRHAGWPTSTSCCDACRGPSARSSSTSAWCCTARRPTSSTSTWSVDADRLRALHPDVDVDQVCDALTFADWVCRGDERGGEAARQSLGQRFGFLKAPRSTVLQPGPVHGGLTGDPARQLEHLRERLVG